MILDFFFLPVFFILYILAPSTVQLLKKRKHPRKERNEIGTSEARSVGEGRRRGGDFFFQRRGRVCPSLSLSFFFLNFDTKASKHLFSLLSLLPPASLPPHRIRMLRAVFALVICVLVAVAQAKGEIAVVSRRGRWRLKKLAVGCARRACARRRLTCHLS